MARPKNKARRKRSTLRNTRKGRTHSGHGMRLRLGEQYNTILIIPRHLNEVSGANYIKTKYLFDRRIEKNKYLEGGENSNDFEKYWTLKFELAGWTYRIW